MGCLKSGCLDCEKVFLLFCRSVYARFSQQKGVELIPRRDSDPNQDSRKCYDADKRCNPALMKERSVAPKDSIWDGKLIRYFCPMNIVPSSQCQQNKHARRRYNVVCYVSRKYERPSSAIGMIMTGAIAVGGFCYH